MKATDLYQKIRSDLEAVQDPNLVAIDASSSYKEARGTVQLQRFLSQHSIARELRHSSNNLKDALELQEDVVISLEEANMKSPMVIQSLRPRHS